MSNKSWRAFAASALLALMIGTIGQTIPAACAVEVAAEHIAGFQPKRSVAVEQAVTLIRQGHYSLALLPLTSQKPATSMPPPAPPLRPYALLLAGNSFGAFPDRG